MFHLFLRVPPTSADQDIILCRLSNYIWFSLKMMLQIGYDTDFAPVIKTLTSRSGMCYNKLRRNADKQNEASTDFARPLRQ